MRDSIWGEEKILMISDYHYITLDSCKHLLNFLFVVLGTCFAGEGIFDCP
jgi:hypothetical protein